MMHNRIIVTCCLFLASCSTEVAQPPHVEVNRDILDPEAANVIENAQLAVASSPSSMQSWQNFGKLLHAHGLDEQAVIAYGYANQLQPTSETTYLQALVSADTGNYEKAIALCNEISTYTPAIWRQGFWLLDLGRLSQAKEKFEFAIVQDSSAVAALVGKAFLRILSLA